MYTQLNASLISGDKKLNLKTMDAAYAEAQNAYHTYTQCVFDFVECSILQAATGDEPGENDACSDQAKNFPWKEPQNACFTEDQTKKMIEDTDYTKILPPIRNNYND